MKYSNSKMILDFLNEIPNKLQQLSYEDLTILCNKYLPSIPISILDFTNERYFFNQRDYGGINVIYRARLSQVPRIDKVSKLSYIHLEETKKITKFGRVNKPYESMFYGSLDFGVACFEAFSKGNIFKNNKSAVFTVGVWKFEAPLTFAKMEHSEKYFNLFQKEIGLKSDNLNIEDIKKNNSEFKLKFDYEFDYEIFRFFSDEFAKFHTTDHNEYKLCNYYADRVLNRINNFKINENIDGILYPSVAATYEKSNIALKPSVVDTKLKFIEAFDVWVTIWGDKGEIRFTPMRERAKADTSGNLDWFPNRSKIIPPKT